MTPGSELLPRLELMAQFGDALLFLEEENNQASGREEIRKGWEEGRRGREKCGGEGGGNGQKKGTGAIRQEQGEPKAHSEHSGAAVGIRETKGVGEGRTDRAHSFRFR